MTRSAFRPAPASTTSRQPVRILVVDDTEENLIAMEALLDDLGETVVRARSGKEALAALLDQEFALVLLDLRMPDMEGLEVASLIRGQARFRALPILFVSAFEPDRKDLEAAYELGAADFIVKPIVDAVLRTKVRVFLDLYRARVELSRRVEERTVALGRSERRLADALAGARMVAWEWDTRRDLVTATENLNDIYGLAPGQELSRANQGFALLDPRDRDRHTEVLRAAIAEKKGYRSQFRIVRPLDGKVVWLEEQARPLIGSGGELEGFAGVVVDITDRRRGEEGLRFLAEAGQVLASSLDYETTIQKVADLAVTELADWCVVDMADEGRLRRVAVAHRNPDKVAWAKQLHERYPSDPDNPRGVAEVLRSGRATLIPEVTEDILRAGARDDEHFRILKDAGIVSVLLAPMAVSGRVLGVLTCLSTTPARRYDESDLALAEALGERAALAAENARLYRQATEELAERQRAESTSAFLGQVVQSTNDAVVTKTLQGRITSWNAAAERIFGYSAAEAIGQSITIVIPDDRLDEEKFILARIARGERVDHFETVRRRKDGTLFDISVTISPVMDSIGRIIGASKVARDITHQKRVEAEILRLNDTLDRRVRERTASLEDMLRELDTFAYTVAHDLRAPVRAMQGFSDILLEEFGPQLGERGRDLASRIAKGGERMAVLIRDLLAYSRLSREAMTLGPVGLEGLVADVLRDLDDEIQASRAEVRVEGPLPAVLAHEMSLRQALTNLLTNAMKFVPEGLAPRVRILAESSGGQVTLEVEDNGIGIPEKDQARLFRVFERLHAGDRYPGTGIGLAIVRRALERMGGAAGVASVPGRGSRFWVALPEAPGIGP
jgi:PAS domain S-box-containing protein